MSVHYHIVICVFCSKFNVHAKYAAYFKLLKEKHYISIALQLQ